MYEAQDIARKTNPILKIQQLFRKQSQKKKKDYYGLTSCDKCSTEDEQGYKIANWWISLQLYMKGLKGCNWTRYLKS